MENISLFLTPRKSFAIGAILAFLLVSVEVAVAQTVSGSVLSVSGEVSLHRGSEALPLRSGATVDALDELVTGSRGRVAIGFADKNQIELGEDSDVAIATGRGASGSSHGDRVDLKSGIVEAFASSLDLEIRTVNAVIITHHGKADTSYYTEAQRRGFPSCARFTDVAVLDGSADVVASGESRAVPAGYTTTVACSDVALSPGPLGIAEARTLSEETARGSGLLYNLFHGSSPNVEQEDIDGAVRDRGEDDPRWARSKGGPVIFHHPRPSLAKFFPRMVHHWSSR